MISAENVKKRNSVKNESVPLRNLWKVRKTFRLVTQKRHLFSKLGQRELYAVNHGPQNNES